MTEPRRDTIVVQREIAATRSDLVTNVERLRGVLRRRLSLRAQAQAHPRLVTAVAVVLSLPLFAITFAVSAAYTRRRRAQRTRRWLSQRTQRWLTERMQQRWVIR